MLCKSSLCDNINFLHDSLLFGKIFFLIFKIIYLKSHSRTAKDQKLQFNESYLYFEFK